MKVKLCKKNQWTNAVTTMITESHPNINISTKKCIDKCHTCKVHPIAKVDKEVLVGVDAKKSDN
ncbi:DUF1450 domain-containing protein [Clostridium lacusfryxellense]|uniref:DUF1450 domain-containing protein n=1 Tax=Clostridium lacusfryxellense TaxID=205328 RepID=UPI001C0DA35B|nr:DUF1450 domain-containing protein [Clostridium lacusfryxellense]MBU3111504.1 DUF1450 domain-containing protein [Clostridium lacusfryxellense]